MSIPAERSGQFFEAPSRLQEWKDDPAAVDPRVSAQSDEVTQAKPLINLANQFAEMKIAAELLLKSKGVKIE